MIDREANFKKLAIYNKLVERTKYNWGSHDLLVSYLIDSLNNYNAQIHNLEGYVRYGFVV